MVSFFAVIQPSDQRWQAIFNNAVVPEGFYTRGIDISRYQGEIDWNKLSRATINGQPIAFVFMKATEGVTVKDTLYEDNYRQAREHGVLCGAYHFFTRTATATQQAAAFIRVSHLGKGDLPPVLDIELEGELDENKVRRDVLTWLQIVGQKYMVKPIIYTNLKFKRRYLSTPEFSDYPFWIAHYYVPRLGYRGEWALWQYTDRGHVDGINAFVDFNVYNGSMYGLRQLALKTQSQ